ncbi:hypothetical protein VKT23_008320 [Stygiomarasmius scandens]|uniref:beta-N-acetylhexosaminidase n=1 Tax=Marasmiellus scandens TaxID=2682957 RepID=A0ABR1JL63_9AGAR
MSAINLGKMAFYSLVFLIPVIFNIKLVHSATLHPQIPSIKSFTESNSSSPFVITPHVSIVVDSQFQDSGSPSLSSFAQTFRSDIITVTGFNDIPDVTVGDAPEEPDVSTIFLTLGASNFTLFNGQETGEGYEFEVTNMVYTIKGVEAIGAWWGTRTLLQQVLLSLAASNETSIPAGSGSDGPGWEIRGFMLDVGRHWFDISFLTDLCIYASFFKMQEFHVHASDFVFDEHILNGNPNSDAWKQLYATMRFQPSADSPIIDIVAPFANETYSRDQFTNFQTTCAEHGITVIPEIDTPAHSLVISKWKPELAIPGHEDFLNISFPDTIPSVQSIWEEVLPWFTASEVSIGADEYDQDLADDYITFVNSMSEYISGTSGKTIRIWGTDEPSQTQTISTNVTIQHWSFPSGSIPVQLMQQGYSIINSEQGFLYLIGKAWSDGQSHFELDTDTIWTGAPNGGGWAPNIFTGSDASNNTTPDNPLLRGSIMALWNDFGNNATTPLEIYYSLAKSIPVVAEKMWAGADDALRPTRLTRDDFEAAYPVLNAGAPGQNLNRAVKGLTAPATVFEFDNIDEFPMQTGLDSVGPPYTLSFSLQVTNSSGEVPLFTGNDSVLFLDSASGSLTFQGPVTNKFYPLGSPVPFDSESFTKVDIHATTMLTTIAINDGQPLPWETNIGISGDRLRLVNMSFAAPAGVIGSDSLFGEMRNVSLKIGN